MIPCAGVGDIAVDWSAGLGSVVPTSLDPVPESRCSFAVLRLASATVAFGVCHSAEEDEHLQELQDLPPTAVLDVVAK